VAADFRPADVAAGGQGAPLVCLFDALFFQDPLRTRAIQNIGGIGNVTFLPAGGGIEGAYAFDTGPGNTIIDYAVHHVSGGTQRYDHGGALAAQGIPCRELVNDVLSHPFFAAAPPKTTGRETFGDAYASDLLRQAGRRNLSGADILATATAITAESIARAYRAFGPERIDEMVVSGGGARNATLLEMLRRLLPATRVLLHDDFGVSAEAKEAVTFALLGYELLHGRAANVPACTGARSPVILGKLTPGANYRHLMRRTSFRVATDSTRRLHLV
jgi:anhydro-N-acetylmuramic acid kinase